jgi:flagellar biosynthesis/type III secretory pathway protein FliH
MTRIPRRQPDLSIRHSDRYRLERKKRLEQAMEKMDQDHSKFYRDGFRKGYKEGYDDGYNKGYYAGFYDAEYNLESIRNGNPEDLRWRGRKDLSWYWL